MIIFIFGIIVICFHDQKIVNGELFTATADLEVLYKVEQVLIENLKKYIVEHEQKLDVLEKYIKQFYICI